MKTYKKWEKSGLEFDKYLKEPCEIDEEMYHFILEGTCPSYLEQNLGQMGDAMNKNINGVYTYDTVSFVNNKYFYLGVLPAFKTKEKD